MATEKNENQEQETTGEKLADAVWKIENKDAADAVLGSSWIQKTKKGVLGTGGKILMIGSGDILAIIGTTVYYLYKAAEKIIQKGGKVGFSDMYGIFKESKKEK